MQTRKEPNEADDTILDSIITLLVKIESNIKEFAGDDKNEIARINRAFFDDPNLCTELFGNIYSAKLFPNNEYIKDKQSSHVEYCLSAALHASLGSYLCFEQGDLIGAMTMYGVARYVEGVAHGHIEEKSQTIIARKEFFQMAALRKHAPNIAMKEQAIQYYKAHHKSFSSKDDAAFQIAEKVVSAKFATVRGWLKGVNPE